MTLLDQDSFLNQLTKILEKSKTSGTIYVTFKKCEITPPLQLAFFFALDCALF